MYRDRSTNFIFCEALKEIFNIKILYQKFSDSSTILLKNFSTLQTIKLKSVLKGKTLKIFILLSVYYSDHFILNCCTLGNISF